MGQRLCRFCSISHASSSCLLAKCTALTLVERCWRGSPSCLGCAEEVVQREGTKLASRQEFAKRVALDLFRFMESFNKGVQGDTLILPTNCLELWFQKFDSKFRRYATPSID